MKDAKLICHFCKREIAERSMARHQQSRICADLTKARAAFDNLVEGWRIEGASPAELAAGSVDLAEDLAKLLRRYHSNTITKHDILR